jgi:hypothetical protein
MMAREEEEQEGLQEMILVEWVTLVVEDGHVN